MVICPCMLRVLGITVLNVLLGMLWYSPLLLGTVWAKAHKFNTKELKATPWHYLGGICVSFVTVLVFAILVRQFQLLTWQAGALFAFCIWIGFTVTGQFSSVLWAKRPLGAYFIDIGYRLVSLVMIGILLTIGRS